MESDDVEDQLRTTLHCDDKEKLRRKLALLQKEYLRTAQRLQRAERLDVVRKHVRSRITQLNHQNQNSPEVTSKPRLNSPPQTVNGTHGKQQEVPDSQRHTEGLADPDNFSRSQVIRFALSSDPASPQTPNSGHDAARGHQPGSALRLRSRRSRLRWETQGSEACRSSDNSEDGLEPSETPWERERDEREEEEEEEQEEKEEEEKSRYEEVEVVNGSEELFSSSGSESPSLLLTHWQSQQCHAEAEEGKERRIGGGNEGKEDDVEKESLLLQPQNSEGKDCTINGKREEFEENTDKDLNPSATGNEERQDETTETKEEKSGMNGEVKREALLDSCTLVEGLLFPAEYYVRTTRRMSSSQSQPDMRAVILSQLNRGRRGRGRGRGSNRRSPAAAPPPPPSPLASGDVAGVEASPSPPVVSATHPGAARGRRRRRGRGGRGRGGGRRSGVGQSEPSEEPQPSVSDERHVSTCVSGSPPPPQVNGSQCSPGSGRQLSLYPMFLKSSGGHNTPVQSGGSSSDWLPLVLPSPPSSPPSLLLLPLPSPCSASSLARSLPPFDVQLDFHLPDEQFASLKLHKLRRVALESGPELFTPPSRNTRSRLAVHVSGDPATPLPLPLSLTPTIAAEDTAPDLETQEEASKRENTEEAKISESSSETEELGKKETGSNHGNNIKSPKDSDPVCSPPPESRDAVVKTLHFDCPLEETPLVTPPTSDSPRVVEDRPLHARSQLLLSPPLTTATPRPPPSLLLPLLSSPTLPSLGPTPRAGPTDLPLTPSSPAAPALTLPSLPPPPPRSPVCLSPPTLSRCPSVSSLPTSSQERTLPDCCPSVEPTSCPPPPPVTRSTYTLKAPAGGCLVDACCLPGRSGGVCVAAAGKWAVCVWSQSPASDWSLTHTWTFNDPVINVFPVPDAVGLMFVTLGQLEIREVRLLSCSSLSQVLLCAGLVQAVVGVSRSRVVTSSHSATGSSLQVFQVSDHHSAPTSQPLSSPGVCVGALAPVDGLSDALIATDEAGRVFVWNLTSGQLLSTIVLGDALSHTSCLRGYSHCGVLFVLLQHHMLSSLQEGEQEEKEVLLPEDDRKKERLFSLVAVNPLSGKSVVATPLCPPKAWSGRLCEADVGGGGSVVGVSQSGCVCVWELGRRGGGGGGTRMVWAPESEGWQLARWGGTGPDAPLLTGHHNGDVTLHRFT